VIRFDFQSVICTRWTEEAALNDPPKCGQPAAWPEL